LTSWDVRARLRHTVVTVQSNGLMRKAKQLSGAIAT
jgi:hypothetical protein